MAEAGNGAGGGGAQNFVKEFDLKGLYQMEIYTDMVAGQVQRFTPVNEHGVRDVTRFVRFFSSVTLTQNGRPIPVNFELKAGSLAEAFRMFREEGTKAAMDFLEKMEAERVKRSLQGGRSSAGMLPQGPKIVVPN